MATRRRGTPVVVTVDPILKKRWAEASARLAEASREGAKAWDQRYEAIADIIEHEPPLFLAGGLSSERQFFEQHVGEDRTTAYRNIRVAKYASPKDVERWGASRLDQAITFVETKNGGPLRGRTPVDFAALRFPVVRAGKSVNLSLDELTVEQLRAAVAQLKGREAGSKKASPAAAAIAAALGRANVKSATFHLTSKALVLRLPLADLNKAGAALAKVKLPG